MTCEKQLRTRSFQVAACAFVLLASCSLNGCKNKVENTSSEGNLSKDASTKQAAQTESQRLTTFTEMQLRQKEKAVKICKAMGKSLMGELMKSMMNDGPAKSIRFCKAVAPKISNDLCKEGIQIGRTSFKLRNSINRVPDWAKSFVTSKTATPTFVELPEQKLGALLPIHIKPVCLTCHGEKDSLDPSVAKALQSSYPHDKATGFSEGDLRGYFWVEVDKLKKSTPDEVITPEE